MKNYKFISVILIVSIIALYGFKSFNSKTKDNILYSKTIVTGTGIGQQAPELKFKTPNGTLISLSSLRGKMVLIDFWASWCRPCRYENPNVVKAYNKYKDSEFTNGKGFTVYSVSLDKYKSQWEKAISNDKLVWKNHVSDLAGWRSQAAAIYGVRGIPSSFLIDGNGIIVAKGSMLRGSGLENTLKLQVK